MTDRARFLLCFVGLMAAFSTNAAAQISPGTLTGGASPWPVYVYDTEMLNKGDVIISGIGIVGFLADDSKSYSLYSGLDLGITRRFLISLAVSGSTSDTVGWQLDGTALHAKYKVVDRDSFDFAIAGNLERLPYMEEAGYTAFDSQILGIVQESAGGFAAYGQIGYSSRNQLFEGFAARYGFYGRAIVSGNFSYRHEGGLLRRSAAGRPERRAGHDLCNGICAGRFASRTDGIGRENAAPRQGRGSRDLLLRLWFGSAASLTIQVGIGILNPGFQGAQCAG
jgi:hypothetical protein